MTKKNSKEVASDRGFRLRVGTSGYSYAEWVPFYPSGTKSSEMLKVYAEHFSIVELNYTWYQMPKPDMIERQMNRAPENFLFATKLTRTLTHEVDADSWQKEIKAYRRGISPLIGARRLLAVLVQLPPSFERSAPHRRYLAKLLDALSGLPLAVEFRHASWANDRVFAELERRAVTLVTVDAPELPWLFPALDVVTNPRLIYARFHGRNLKGWSSGNMQLQFDYDYSDEELQKWVEDVLEKMANRARSGALFFNNHVRAQAPRNAEQLRDILRGRGYEIG
jgi:uncharacterized protein YecE (DUF72 family)